jgi:hypothetical protein
MFCRFCGASLAADSIFCHSCGKSLSEQRPQATAAGVVGLQAHVKEGLGFLEATLMFVACLVMFLFGGIGVLLNLNLVGTYYGTGSPVSIGGSLFCLVLTVVFGGCTVVLAKQWFSLIISSDADTKKASVRLFIRSISGKWKIIAASFVPIVAIYQFAARRLGVQTPLSQILILIGYATTLSLGCGGLAYWLVSGFFSDVLHVPEGVSEFFSTAAVIATIGGLLDKFPYRSLIGQPGSNWTNPVVIIVAGFGLSIVFGVYFWLIWRPISTWLKS